MLLIATALMSNICLAKSMAPASLSSQSIAKDLSFYYPVRPSELALFGTLTPPTSAKLHTSACLSRGSWAMFWVPALSHIQLRVHSRDPQGQLRLLKVSGPKVLQGILAFVEHPVEELEDGRQDVFNPDSTRRAFLVSSSTPTCLSIQGPSFRSPELAWNNASREDWRTQDPLRIPTSQWFDHNPTHPLRLRRTAQVKALRELTSAFPESWAFARWLATLQRLELAQTLEPGRLALFGQEQLHPTWNPRTNPAPDFSDPSQPFATTSTQHPVTLDLQGPGNFELRARVWTAAHSQTEQDPPTLDLNTTKRRLATLELLQPRPNQDAPSVGPIAKHRFWLPKGRHQLSFVAKHGSVRLSLRRATSARPLAKTLANATPARALRKARAQRRNIAKRKPELARSLGLLTAPWQPEPPGARDLLRAQAHLCQASRPWLCALSASILRNNLGLSPLVRSERLATACRYLSKLKLSGLEKAAQQQQLAQLAEGLSALGQSQAGAQCLSHPPQISSTAYLKTSLKLQEPERIDGGDPWLATAMAWFKTQPASLALKRAYLRRKQSRTRLIALKPIDPASKDPVRWLTARDPEGARPIRQPGWSEISPDQRYFITPTPGPNRTAQVMRLLVARPGPATAATLRLGDKDDQIEVGERPRIYHWIISDQDHKLAVLAPQGTRILCDQPLRSIDHTSIQHYAQRQYWAMDPGAAPLGFRLGQDPAPTSLKLRVQVSDRPEHRQTLPLTLRRSNGPTLGVWLHYDPKTIDPSLVLGDFARSSFPLTVQLGVLPADSQVWIAARKHAPRLAVSIQQSRLSIPPRLHPPHLEQPSSATNQLEYQVQGPFSLKARIERAKAFLHAQDIGSLRDELEWMAKADARELGSQKTSLLSLLDAISLRNRRALFSIHDPEVDALALRAQFLDDPKHLAKLRPRQVEKALHDRARSLDRKLEDATTQALLSISNYLAVSEDDHQNRDHDPLVYGMLEKITERISGGILGAWKGALARKTRWKNIEYASQSAGHEWLDLSAPAQDAAPLFTPWPTPTHAFLVHEHQNKIVRLNRDHSTQLRIQGYCQPLRPAGQKHPARLTISVDRRQRHQINLSNLKVAQYPLELAAGKHQLSLSVQHQADRQCALRILEKRPQQDAWSPVQLDRIQRWFVASPQAPVSLSARGPGTIKLQIRALDPRGTTQAVTIKGQGPQSPSFSTVLQLPFELDPSAHLSRALEQSSSKPVERTLLMSHPGVYRYQIQSSGPQYLVRASTRVPAKTRSAKQRLQGAISTLKERLSRQGPELTVARPPMRRTGSFPKAGIKKRMHPSSAGVWQLQADTGLLSDLDYDELNTRRSSQLHAAWLGTLWPHRVWLKTQLSLGTENRVVPAARARAQVFAASQRAWLRGNLQLSGAGQYLHRMAYRFGFSGRLEFSLRALLAQPSSWDLLSDLRFSYRGLSRSTKSIAEGSLQKALHRYVYRSYVRDHPFSLRPRIQLVWRRFYDIRAYLGQDLWLNADLKSLDRTRSWLKVSGLVTPFKTRRHLFWTYDTGYRLSIVPKDTHRSQAFLRNEFILDLKAALRVRPEHLWEVSLSSALISQSQQPVSARLMLGLRVSFDQAGPVTHRPIQQRRYPRELKTNDWTYPELAP